MAAAPREPSDNPWIRRFHPAPAASSRLVCFPHAGGSASFYFPVSRALSPDVEVLAIQYPGRQDRRSEPCVDSIEALADAVQDQLPQWFDRPVFFFGHSMGATLAFETARRLEGRAVRPAGLFVSGRRAPSRHRDERVHQHSDDQLLADIKRLSGTDSQVLDDPELMRSVLPAVRSDYKAAETYRYQPGPALSCPVFAFTGDSDPQVTLEEARSWSEHTEAPFELKAFPGGHFYLNSQATAVIGAIRSRISSLRSTSELAQTSELVQPK
ncbi:alpha/beta fold hydrolase [Streptomyces sp. E11-3]|uniref:thioesterase II family protein n=1 Tax=Streptomyces sp. E11-3 TaxID=3110112 RepID=UPI0039809DF2